MTWQANAANTHLRPAVFQAQQLLTACVQQLASLSDFINLHPYSNLYCNISYTKLFDDKKQAVDTMDVDDDPTALQDQVKTFSISYLINSLHILAIIVLLHVWQWW